MSAPDKCPKCGADSRLRRKAFACGSTALGWQSQLCEERAAHAETQALLGAEQATNLQLHDELTETRRKLGDAERAHGLTIDQRDAAENAANLLTASILGEAIDWSDHSAKWAEALDKLQEAEKGGSL